MQRGLEKVGNFEMPIINTVGMSRVPVNRHRRNIFNSTALQLYTNLDLIASTLLMINYSDRTSMYHKSQALIQMDCVAVCFVKPDVLWVASNKKTINDDSIAVLNSILHAEGIRNVEVWKITNGSTNMHAEMQLLSELIQCFVDDYRITDKNAVKEQIQTLRLSFGVSKPCCKRCNDILRNHHIDFTMWHNDRVIHWENPYNDSTLNRIWSRQR
jgi:hypothetical protein